MAPTTDTTTPGRTLSQEDLTFALEWFWHPVATIDEVDAADGVLAVTLLEQELVTARLASGSYAVLTDRCPHRSTRLSVGWVDGEAIRCAYHGWRWDMQGRCVEIPSAPDQPIPARFRQSAYEAIERYGLVWVRLRAGAPTEIPSLPAADDPTMRLVAGTPYTWPTSAPRRVENFVDLAHFAWVHDGTLGRRDEPVPPLADIGREAGEMRFRYDPPQIPDLDSTALVGFSDYRMPMPLTVNIEFDIVGRPGVVRHLWMTASPLGPGKCRSFWFVARNDDHDGSDEEYLNFQRYVLEEDEPVVCNQVPPEIPLEPGDEMHVKADRVSIEYRKWLRELVVAALAGPSELGAALDPRHSALAHTSAGGPR